MIDTIIHKYSNHLPVYRQSAMLERDTGLELSWATLDGWVLKVGELLMPMVAVMRQELIGGPYIEADETPVEVGYRRAGEESSRLSLAVQPTKRDGGV